VAGLPQRSMLVRWRRPGAAPPFVTFHDRGDALDALVDLCERAVPGRALHALQAPRSCNALAPSAGPGAGGHAWYAEDRVAGPEPASFGDALAQGELALLEVVRDEGVACVAVGRGQGATLVRALAALRPDLVGAAVAWGGAPARVAGWCAPPGGAPLLALDPSLSAREAARRVAAFRRPPSSRPRAGAAPEVARVDVP